MSTLTTVNDDQVLRVRDSVVASSQVALDKVTCPHCRTADVWIEGTYRRSFVERRAAGASSEDQAPRIERHVDAVICPACEIRFEIRPDQEMIERRDYFRLKLIEAEAAGTEKIPAIPKRMVM